MGFLSNKQHGALYAIASGLCYGLLGYFGISLMKNGLSVSNMLFWRFFIASLFMIIILLPQYKIILDRPKESFKVAAYGIAFYSTSAIVYFIASKYIGTGLSMVIFFTYPAMVMLFNVIFYKTPMSRIYYFAFAMIVVGMVCLADLQECAFDIFGIGFGLLSAVFYSSYIIASKESKASPLVSTLMVSIGSGITCFVLSYMESSFFIPTSLHNWFNIAGIGIICTALPILLFLQALKYITSEKASILSVLEPVFVVIFGIILLDEKISTIQIIGVVIVLSGAVLSLFSKTLSVKNI